MSIVLIVAIVAWLAVLTLVLGLCAGAARGDADLEAVTPPAQPGSCPDEGRFRRLWRRRAHVHR